MNTESVISISYSEPIPAACQEAQMINGEWERQFSASALSFGWNGMNRKMNRKYTAPSGLTRHVYAAPMSLRRQFHD